jgi:biopolymer transport protein ExbD
MGEKEFDYMNVIPLVDVMLVLLTIVLTTSTFIATGAIKVDLPGVKKSTPDLRRKTVTIVINSRGECYLNDKPLRVEDLKRGAMLPRDRETPVQIRADKSLPVQRFVDVLQAVRELGFKAVTIQVQEKTA